MNHLAENDNQKTRHHQSAKLREFPREQILNQPTCLPSHLLLLHSMVDHMVFSFSPPPWAMARQIPQTRNTCSCLHIWTGQAWLQFRNLHVGPIPLLDKEILLTGGLICMSLPTMPTQFTDVAQTLSGGEDRRKVRLWKQTEMLVYVTENSSLSVLYQEMKCNAIWETVT